MKLTDDAAARQIDPATMATWIDLASINGEATVYRVYWSDDDTYHVVEQPEGPGVVVLAVSEHLDYVWALRAIAACVEEEDLAAGRHTATPLDITPRLRIRRTWYCDAGPHTGLHGVGLEPLYVTEDELNALQAAYGRKEGN